ncbi:fibronectin type III-like domain-contianing protein [Streptomyces griseorubiginosus]|uniref:fibronectin type III-like domain-contianing protein n=1 Tax=Streptomyces griseorubiginosus TaxID=67304 RepID=UPI0036E73AD2
MAQLTGFTRVRPEPGEQRRVTFRLHTDRFACTGQDLHRIVEPGAITVMLGSSSTDIRLTDTLRLTVPVRGQATTGSCTRRHTPTERRGVEPARSQPGERPPYDRFVRSSRSTSCSWSPDTAPCSSTVNAAPRASRS